jgi:hypothetical protein
MGGGGIESSSLVVGRWGGFSRLGGVWVLRLLDFEGGGAELRSVIGDVVSCCLVDDGAAVRTELAIRSQIIGVFTLMFRMDDYSP